MISRHINGPRTQESDNNPVVMVVEEPATIQTQNTVTTQHQLSGNMMEAVELIPMELVRYGLQAY